MSKYAKEKKKSIVKFAEILLPLWVISISMYKKIHDQKMPHQIGMIPGNQNVDKTPEMYPIITPPDTPENDTGKHKTSKM